MQRAEKLAAAAHREGAQAASPSKLLRCASERRHPACMAAPPQKRNPLAREVVARASARHPKARVGKTPAYRLYSGTPGKLARAARDARMHGLSTLTRGTERILPRPSDPAGFPTKKTAPNVKSKPPPISCALRNGFRSNLMSLRSRRRTARGPWSILTARARCSRPKCLLRGPRARPAHELPRPPEGAACAATPSPPFENRPAACCAHATGPQIAATEGSFT